MFSTHLNVKIKRVSERKMFPQNKNFFIFTVHDFKHTLKTVAFTMLVDGNSDSRV